MEENEKRDEEQIVEDTDADTSDVVESEKTDEEQIVEDTDADTRDIDSKLDEILSTLNALADAVSTAFENVANVMIKSGAVENDGTDEDIIEEAAEDFVVDFDDDGEVTIEDAIEAAMELNEEE